MTTARTILIATAAIATVIVPLIAATSAQAKGGRSGYYYHETFRTARPERGYEGFIGGGHYNAYCSYRREPNRRCVITRSGRERCRIVSWRLVQHCY